MSKIKKKSYRGRARVEFLACKPEIDVMLDKGYSIRMAYDVLKEKNKISVGYLQFLRYVTGKTASKVSVKVNNPEPNSAAVPPAAPAEQVATPKQPGSRKYLNMNTRTVVDVTDGFESRSFNKGKED